MTDVLLFFRLFGCVTLGFLGTEGEGGGALFSLRFDWIRSRSIKSGSYSESE